VQRCPYTQAEESERDKGIIAAEVLSIAPNAFCQAAVRWPLLVMFLTMIGPVLMSAAALGLYGMQVDFSLDSFRIRDHPVVRTWLLARGVPALSPRAART